MTYQVQDAGLLDDMQDPEELRSLSAWKVHTPTGDRNGTWSLSVTRNRRIWRSPLRKPLE